MVSKVLIGSVIAAVTIASTVAVVNFKARGSDSTSSVMKALAQHYHQQTGNTLQIEGGGSAKGSAACINGTVPLAFLSRNLNDAEKHLGLVSTQYAFDAVAIIVHPDNPIDGFPIDELRDIYTGVTTRWPNGSPIVLLTRNIDSGSRECFMQVVLKDAEFSSSALVKRDAEVVSSVAADPHAIGFTSFGEVKNNPAVKKLAVNGVLPSSPAIREKSYPLWRPLIMATKGAPTPEVAAYISFVLSDDGQRIVEQSNYVSISTAPGIADVQPRE